MSSDIIYPQFDDGFSDSSTVIGVDKTREEYLKLFSRASYSPLCDRPYSSPISGPYNAVNSTTSLILLNQRFKNSHLREQVLPEEIPTPIPQDFAYESFIVTDPPHLKIKPKPKPIKKTHSTHIPVDPYRHFQSQTKYWHDQRCTCPSVIDNLTDISQPEPTMSRQSRTPHITPRRSKSDLSRKTKHRSSTESFCQYYRDLLEKTPRNEFDLCEQPIEEVSRPATKSNENRQKSTLTKGQEIYLLGKHHIYDLKDTKVRRTNSYAQSLSNRYKTDYNCKPRFRLNDPQDYSKYSKYLNIARSLTPMSPKKSIDFKSVSTTKSFTLTNPKPLLAVRIQAEPKKINI